MTQDMMTLRALLEKSSDADLLREMIGFTAERLMALEVDGLTGAGHGERSADRITHRNGYRDRSWETRAGTVEMKIPKLRNCLSCRALRLIPSRPVARLPWRNAAASASYSDRRSRGTNREPLSMTDQPKSTFARRVRAARPCAKKYDIWDDVISGLGLRVGTSGHRSFFLRRSVRGRIRSATIGNAETMSVPEARAEARRLIATFIDTVKKDNGPRTPGHPMDAFAGEFLERHARHWKPRTLESNAYMVRKYILPAFGHMTLDDIAVEHVRDWFASMAKRAGVANRSMPVLSTMMKMAELWGYRVHNSNPCKNTKRYPMKAKERFLTPKEMARLNAVLTRDEFWRPHIVAIVRC